MKLTPPRPKGRGLMVMKVREKTKWKVKELKKVMRDFRDAVNGWLKVIWRVKRADRSIHSLAYKELRKEYSNYFIFKFVTRSYELGYTGC